MLFVKAARASLISVPMANLGVLGEDASVRHVMAGGRRRVSDGEVMIYSTNRARIQEPNA